MVLGVVPQQKHKLADNRASFSSVYELGKKVRPCQLPGTVLLTP